MRILNKLVRKIKKVRYGLRNDDLNYIDYLPFWCLTLREKNFLAHCKDFFLDQKKYHVQKKVFKIWQEQFRERDKPIYWAGWLYQSLESMHLYGWRSSEKRIEIYRLREYLDSSNRVLDIGANLGCIPLILHDSCRQWVCIEPNPYLMQINKVITDANKINNLDFIAKGFEEYESDDKFDSVFSFASHSTYDGNTKLSPQQFFSKVSGLLKDGGLFFFESHNGEIDNPENYEKIHNLIKEHFQIIKQYPFLSPEKTLSNQKQGVYREFIIAQKKTNLN